MGILFVFRDSFPLAPICWTSSIQRVPYNEFWGLLLQDRIRAMISEGPNQRPNVGGEGALIKELLKRVQHY